MSARNEVKYMVDLETRHAMQRGLAARLVPGEFVEATGGYPVLSLYYDGETLPCYIDKVAGVERRVKVRLRTYAWSFDAGKPGAAPWFLEAKHKDGPFVAKRRVTFAPGRIDPLRTETWDA